MDTPLEPNIHPLPPFWFIFDVESIGLHGEAFAVAAQIFDHRAQPIPTKGGWWHHFPPQFASGMIKNHEWVAENVTCLGTHSLGSAHDLREFFWAAWDDAKVQHPGIVMAAECAWPVEARFLAACVDDDPIARQFAGPYPLHDIASIMLAAKMDPMATYERDPAAEYPAHHPLGDVQHSAVLLSIALATLESRHEL